MNSNLSFPIPNSELPQGWHWVKLGEVCEVVTGATPRTDDPNNWDGEILWATPNDMGKLRGYIIEDTERKISHKGFESCSTKLLPPGSILLTTRAPIGHLAINLKPMCTNQGFKSLIPSSQIHNWFLFFVLKYFVPVLQSMGRGQTFTEISKGQVETFGIPLPPLPEQIRIAAKIQELMQEVERARTACEKQLEAAKALLSAYLREVFECEEAKRWERKRLGEVAEKFVNGGTPNTSVPNYWNGNIPWITGADITSLWVSSGRKLITDEGLNNSATHLVKENTVLIVTRTGVGKVGIAANDLCFSQDITGVICGRKILPEFLARFLLFQEGILVKAQRGATIKGLTRDDIESIDILVPSPYVQERIISDLKEKMAQVENLQSATQTQQDALNSFPQAILRQAFNGEL